MSFDQYFESSEKMSHRSKNSDDWYSIVEEALFAADVASRQHRQQLEVGLIKPLPVIPEDDAADSVAPVKELYLTCRPISATTANSHRKSPDSKQKSSPWTDDQQCYVLDTSNDHTISRRLSGVYITDLDSPLSLETFDLDTWASDVCATVQSGMSSLRSKPYTRQSSVTSSTVSQRSMSTGSSILVSRPRSTSSSVYSTDTNLDSYGSSAHNSVCMHSRNPSAKSGIPPRQMRSEEEEDSRTSFSFFDFSDSDEEETEVTVARPESSASNYVKHLRRKALSLRMPTSKKAQVPVRILSAPSRDGPGLSTWFFRSLSTDRSSMLSVDNDIGLENQLMVGAAASAKAKRVLGLR